jgi:hypothetical protein
MINRLHFRSGTLKNSCMRQGSLFSRAQIAAMRDPTTARNHSPSRDEFRREHERRRAFGLQRRHAEKLRRPHHTGSTPPTTAGPARPPKPATRRTTPGAPATASERRTRPGHEPTLPADPVTAPAAAITAQPTTTARPIPPAGPTTAAVPATSAEPATTAGPAAAAEPATTAVARTATAGAPTAVAEPAAAATHVAVTGTAAAVKAPWRTRSVPPSLMSPLTSIPSAPARPATASAPPRRNAFDGGRQRRFPADHRRKANPAASRRGTQKAASERIEDIRASLEQ